MTTPAAKEETLGATTPTEANTVLSDEQNEPDRCHWQSRDLGMCVKVWDTGCGDVRERLPDGTCPTCGKRVWLTGFDAWWEARKSYHP